VVLVGIVYVFLPSLLDDFSNFLTTVPRYVDTMSLWDPVKTIDNSSGAFQELSAGVGKSKNLLTEIVLPNTAISEVPSSGSSLGEIIANFQRAFSSFSGGFFQTLSVIFGGILSFILIVVLSFYFSVQENGINTFLRIITPIRHEKYVVDLWRRSQEKIGRWMQGQLLLGILVGVLVFLGLTVLGVRNALLFAFIAAVFEIIPVFGPILSAIPPVITAFSQAGLPLALLTTGLFIIIQQFENHLVYPLVVRKIVGVSPILVILALIVGAKLAGFLGILLSVPVATVLMEYFNDLERRKVATEGKESSVS